MLGLFAFTPVANAAFTYSRAPSTSSFTIVPVTINASGGFPVPTVACQFNGGTQWKVRVIKDDLTQYDSPTYTLYANGTDAMTFAYSLPVGNYTAVKFICVSHSAQDTFIEGTGATTIFSIVNPPYQAMLNDANSGFLGATGFALSDTVTWSGDTLIKLFMGSGLALLYELRWWIMALIMISLLVYFAYRAFRFYRH
jgi:hypothetical protein